MDKLKRQFSELRAAMPKYARWLLLAAAFIVVLILLTLLLTRHGGNDDVKHADSEPVELSISNDNIDWADTRVGDQKSESIKITATAPARVSVRMTKEIPGLDARHTCTGGEVNATIPCTITLKYTPTAAMDATAVPIFVDYRAAGEGEDLNIHEKITLMVGAVAPAPITPSVPAKPAVTVDTTPAPAEPVAPAQPANDYTFDMPDVAQQTFTAPKPAFQAEIQREIETIAPSDPFAGYMSFEEPIDTDVAPIAVAEKCSDFAFPGYDTSGNQAGWIKPERGGYYFHPFSDIDCVNPTGTYNPDTGLIMDIRDTGKKIGTDAEHIGYAVISVNAAMPQLTDSPRSAARFDDYDMGDENVGGFAHIMLEPSQQDDVLYATSDPGVVISTQPYDRSFILRQYKPIPATIVSDVRADATLLNGDQFLPVRATVDRNVYADNGRTIIIPTGTLMLGYVTGQVPGPYKTIGRMEIKWYQFVLPNGVEFNFNGDGNDPFSGDSQGRIGVPGRGSTDYLEQFVMPMLTAIVPAAVNMIAPIADRFVNQIDLDNNTVVQSGTVRSSELAKNEIITAWNQVAQKLMVDMMDNTVPPFTIPAGTRITVYSPNDLAVVCMGNNKKCSLDRISQRSALGNPTRNTVRSQVRAADDDSWVGQVRSFNWGKYCDGKGGVSVSAEQLFREGLDYRNVLFYCQTNQYQAINNARQDAMFQAQKDAFQSNYGVATNTNDGIWGKNNQGSSLTGIVGNDTYNEKVLGLVADDNGYLSLPQEQLPVEENILTCLDGSLPDGNGCCAGEIYTDMGELGFNCCPETGGDCFPPIQ